jgi:hypothetical protein
MQMTLLSNITRMPSDPKIIKSGPGTLAPVDVLGRGLAWFGICLGAAEILAPGRIGKAFGISSPGAHALIRFFGAREIAAGVITLSTEKKIGLWGRVAGDAMDIAALVAALDSYNPKRKNIYLALGAVLGVAALDLFAAGEVTARSSRKGAPKNYADRTGFPGGSGRARLGGALASRTRQLQSDGGTSSVRH